MEPVELKLRVAIIGPVLPFRGGIAQHTTMLSRALSKFTNLKVYSYYRQYPQWLFPGETDRDPAHEEHQEQNTSYCIDSLNPLTWHRLVHEIREFKPETVIIPWWTVFWAPSYWYITRKLQQYGFNITFFCHNVIEHESAAWKSYLTRLVLKSATDYVVHSQEDKKQLLSIFPAASIRVHPHPVYDHFPPPQGTLARRKKLEVLFYGFVRPYKGIDTLVNAMNELKGQDIQLTIAGEFWEDENKILGQIDKYGLQNQVEVRPRYHNNQETAELFARADIIVLPYLSATGSGVIPIAYHYNKPVIVSRVGGLPDVVWPEKTGYIIEPGAINELAALLSNLDPAKLLRLKPAIETFKKQLSWENLAITVIGHPQTNTFET